MRRCVILPNAVPATNHWSLAKRPARTISVSTFSPVSAPRSTSTTSATAAGGVATPTNWSVLLGARYVALASPGVELGGSSGVAGNAGSASTTSQTRAMRRSKLRCMSAETGTACSASRVQSTSTRPCSCSLWHCRLSSARVSSKCASGRSILLRAKTTGTRQRAACMSTSSVCTSAPCSTETTTTATSAADIVRPRWSSKTSWPGVSMKVQRRSSTRPSALQPGE
mmetsp:Transcript_53927/g.151545  ORF Transcript_53927/g.151545 Transcript_53927/m.151545 type:complete len:226 (+) Transcript_53927:373-1050(+)